MKLVARLVSEMQTLRIVSASIVSYRNVFFLSTRVELMTTTQKKMLRGFS